jgi:CRP/FNR family cyclic AMP-dependent transcriptional regulator
MSERTLTPAELREIGLFGGLPDETLLRLAAELPRRHVQIGEGVVEEGGPAREMFVVLDGELEVLKRAPDGKDVRLGLLGPTDCFGEMALIEVQARSATVRALAPSLLLVLSAEQVDRLLYRQDMKAYALLVMNIARELSRRLRVADGILAQFMSAAQRYVGAPKDDGDA